LENIMLSSINAPSDTSHAPLARAEIPANHQIYIVDDDDGFRCSIVRLLHWSGLTVTGYRCAGEYLLGNHPECPTCVVLDIQMPGPSGLELLDSLATRPNSPPAILVTAFGDVPATVRAIKSGAIDFLTKPVDSERLIRAIRAALLLDAHRRAARTEVQQLRERFGQLSPCERDVFVGVVNGKLNKQLAGTLGICERSIKSYRSRVMRKMNAASLAELVRTAKLLDLESRGSRAVDLQARSPRELSSHFATL
jgi:FixJ family two-component response regulator